MSQSLRALSILTVVAASCGDMAPAGNNTAEQKQRLTHTPDPARELYIGALNVVEDARYATWAPGKSNTDPDGGWSFGRLIDNLLADGQSDDIGRSRFIIDWLKTWEKDQKVNCRLVAARPLIRSTVIDPWKVASGCAATLGTDASCKLRMDLAPFRLLGIVNRPDLRILPNSEQNFPGTGGQGRFMFGVLGSSGQPLPFTVIFEYKLPASSKSDIIAWGEKWHELGTIPYGPAYNEKLHNVTREFTKAKADQGVRSALLQIRTNEVPLSFSTPKLWEMREFILETKNNKAALQITTVKQEPDSSFNNTPLLADYVSANAAAILTSQHVVPTVYADQPFLAGASPVPAGFAWQVPGVGEDLRHTFALGTCSGCHLGETGTSFLHVRNRAAGAVAPVSDFMAAQVAAEGPRAQDFTRLLLVDDVEDGPGLDHGTDKQKDKGKSCN
jgi:hypothetical protein